MIRFEVGIRSMSYQGRSGTEAEKEVAFYFPKAIKKIIQHGEDG